MLACVTASHRVTPVAVLERIAASHEGIGRELVDEFDCVSGAVVIATCNRFEAYLDLDDPLSASADIAFEMVLDELAERTGIAASELQPALHVFTGDRAVEHLFAVASGLESVVVGETEIAGQVRDALDEARRDGTTSSDLERAFQQASQTSRGVRAATGLDQVGRSLAELALELASSRVVSWPEARIVLVGTGRYARVAVAALRRRGAADIAVYSRAGRAAAFAGPRGLTAIAADSLGASLAEADVVVTCSAGELAIHAAELDEARAGAAHELLVLDLGLPRNVDPAVADLPGVTLLDLETVRLHAPLDEFALTDDARSLVAEASRSFADATRELDAVPAISALHRHVAEILDDEIARARSRGEGDEVVAALRHFAGVLLHRPTVRAREHARRGESEAFAQALAALFELQPGAEIPSAERAADAG